MKPYLKVINLFFIMLLLTFNSCYPFVPMKKMPKLKFCYFDPASKSIVNELRNKGMLKYKVYSIVKNENNEEKWLKITEEHFNSPVDSINISILEGFNLKTNLLLIEIWYEGTIIDDCFIEIKSSDWKRMKKVYSRNSRIY